jgi:hypothetical protein
VAKIRQAEAKLTKKKVAKEVAKRRRETMIIE